jgi:hypothetical protein
MVLEMSCSAKMYLAGEEVAEAGEVDIAHTQADSCLRSSGPPARGQVEGQAGEDIGRKPLQAYHTVGSSQRHWDRWGRSVVAEGAGHTGHKEPRHSVAEADIERSVAGNGHIDVVAEAGVGRAGAEAMMTRTAYDMVVVVVDVSDDVSDALTGVALDSGEGVDVEAGGALAVAGERDVGAEAVGRTYGAEDAGAEDTQGQTMEVEGRWL